MPGVSTKKMINSFKLGDSTARDCTRYRIHRFDSEKSTNSILIEFYNRKNKSRDGRHPVYSI